MKKIFVFGSSGFIGRALKDNLIPNFAVYAVGRNEEDIHYDLGSSQPSELNDVVSGGDVWIFLAAISSPEICMSEYKKTFELNVEKTCELISWLTQHGVKVIFASSDAVFSGGNGIFEDNSEADSVLSYGRQKLTVEEKFNDEKLVFIVRFSYVLGAGDKFSDLVMAKARNGETLDVFSGFRRNVVLLSDVIQGIQNLIDHWEDFPFSIANFSGPDLLDRIDIIKEFEKFYPEINYEIVPAPKGFWDARAACIETGFENFSKILGRRPASITGLDIAAEFK